VVLDFLLAREPFVDQAAELIERGQGRQLQLSVASLSFATFYYIMRQQKLTHQATIQALGELAKLVQVLPVTSEHVRLALTTDLPDFEDGIQFFAALEAQADAIVTRAPKGFTTSSILALTPHAALAALA
jgi:hypothetical protein